MFRLTTKGKRIMYRTAFSTLFVTFCCTIAHSSRTNNAEKEYADSPKFFLFDRREKLQSYIRTNYHDKTVHQKTQKNKKETKSTQKKKQIEMDQEQNKKFLHRLESKLEMLEPHQDVARKVIEEEIEKVKEQIENPNLRDENDEDDYSDITVVLLHDWGKSALLFRDLQDRLVDDERFSDKKLKIISYDRYGYGFSESVSTPKHVKNQTIELLELLKVSKSIPKEKLVIVSSGYGSTISHLFNAYYGHKLTIPIKSITINPITPHHTASSEWNSEQLLYQKRAYHPVFSTFGMMEWLLKFKNNFVRNYFLDEYNGNHVKELKTHLSNSGFSYNWLAEYKTLKATVPMLSESPLTTDIDYLCLPKQDQGVVIVTPNEQYNGNYHMLNQSLFKSLKNVTVADKRHNHMNIHKSNLLYDEIVKQAL